MEGNERIEKLLAAILLQSLEGKTQGEKAVMLNRAGLANTEIAELLGSAARTITQQLYESRKKPRKKAKKS